MLGYSYKSILFTIIICLPLRETYIVFPSVYVRPSVRPFVCNAFLSEPDLQESFVQKICKKIQK